MDIVKDFNELRGWFCYNLSYSDGSDGIEQFWFKDFYEFRYYSNKYFFKKLKEEYEHQIRDVNSIFPFNLLQDIMEDCEYQYEFSTMTVKRVMQERLSERENKVLELRYGRNYTLEDTGKELGVTRERIRQVEAKAIRKLRHPTILRSMSVVPYDKYQSLLYENEIMKKCLEDNQNENLKSLGSGEITLEKLDIYSKPIEYLEISIRTFNCLRRKGIRTVKDIVDYAEEHNGNLGEIRNLGRKSVLEIDGKLKMFGIDTKINV